MPTGHVVDLRTARLRANPAYELVQFDRLEPLEQEALEALGRDPDGYGILRPRGATGLSSKAVSRDTALLWLTLQEPGPLPSYAVQMLGNSCNQAIGQMILDGVLEIESGGAMLTGPAAWQLIGQETTEDSRQKALTGLSGRAIEYAASLDIADAVTLSARLYGYNRVAASAQWHDRLPDLSAVERYLGIQNGGVPRPLSKSWVRLRGEEPTTPWIAWSSTVTRPWKARQSTSCT